jgi:cytochrome c2
MRFVPTKAAVGAALILVAGVVLAAVVVNAADAHHDNWAHAAATTGGDPNRGESMFVQYGCGSCHSIAHVAKASGKVGPPLDGIAARAMIAGKLGNTPDNLQHWIRDPQAVTPGTAMPDLHVGEQDARDISAFLYTQTK